MLHDIDVLYNIYIKSKMEGIAYHVAHIRLIILHYVDVLYNI